MKFVLTNLIYLSLKKIGFYQELFGLSGCEVGINRLGDVDTMQRYIYIHGTPYEKDLGHPASEGCIRMGNRDVIELFNLVSLGTSVFINEN